MPDYGGYLLPNAQELDTILSQRIKELLNPPGTFADTSRQAAELAASRGVPGSAAAFGTGLRMTDEERLKRIALGEQFMSSGYSRNLPMTVTPTQQEEIRLKERELALQQQQQLWQQQYQNQTLADQRLAANRAFSLSRPSTNVRNTSGANALGTRGAYVGSLAPSWTMAGGGQSGTGNWW